MFKELYCIFLGNYDKKKIYICSVDMQFFKNVFDPWLVESMDVEPTDMKGSVYTNAHIYYKYMYVT